MQNIPLSIIGTVLHQIWHNNPNAAPPIHIDTADGKRLNFLGINTLWEHIEEGRKTPSAILMIAFNMQSGGPYFLYWTEDDLRSELRNQVEKWRTENLGNREIQKVTFMGIGNTL